MTGIKAGVLRGSRFVEREGVGEYLIVQKHGMDREGKRKNIPHVRNFGGESRAEGKIEVIRGRCQGMTGDGW